MSSDVSDPGNVSALSSEVEALIQKATDRLTKEWGGGYIDAILRDLVRKALATVEAEKQELRGMLNDMGRFNDNALDELLCWYHTADAGSPVKPCGKCKACLREQALALAEALRGVLDSAWPNPADHPAMFKAFVTARAALASWDTSQKESR